ncbi:hypothetical protein D3C81_199930 [compost metagenome]
MSGKLYSLNTRCYVSLLITVSANYCKHHNDIAKSGRHTEPFHRTLVNQPLIPFDSNRAIAFVHAMVKADVSSFLEYGKGDTQADIMAELLFGEGTSLTKGINQVVDDFMTVQEVDDIYMDIDGQLSRFLERGTWAVVDVYDMGKSVSVVIQEDLRIKEWKQLRGYRSTFTPSLELELSDMFSYLRTKTNQTLKPITVVVPPDKPELEGEEKKEPVTYTFWPGERLDFAPMVMEMLLIRYPFLRTDSQLGASTARTAAGSPRNVEILVAAGLVNSGTQVLDLNDQQIRTVNNFIDRLVTPVVESYAVHRFMQTLDPKTIYTVEITTGEKLIITRQDDDVATTTPVDDNVRLKELAESLMRGDYLPTKEREEAERYIQENQ